mmetsp:Transcript_74082/g.130752  ORF Transcript_74082/g.130752 Transcript_74082/m.130752 type:complete len:279 (-) Transcript_74082:1236-2072(-)
MSSSVQRPVRGFFSWTWCTSFMCFTRAHFQNDLWGWHRRQSTTSSNRRPCIKGAWNRSSMMVVVRLPLAAHRSSELKNSFCGRSIDSLTSPSLALRLMCSSWPERTCTTSLGLLTQSMYTCMATDELCRSRNSSDRQASSTTSPSISCASLAVSSDSASQAQSQAAAAGSAAMSRRCTCCGMLAERRGSRTDPGEASSGSGVLRGSSVETSLDSSARGTASPTAAASPALLYLLQATLLTDWVRKMVSGPVCQLGWPAAPGRVSWVWTGNRVRLWAPF